MKHDVTLNQHITLSHPFGHMKELTMRRPMVLDVLTSHESDDDQPAVLLSNLCMISPDEFGELDMSDLVKLKHAFDSLVEFTPITGYEPGKSIPLCVPISVSGVAGTKRDSLTLRRAKVKDSIAARKVSTSAQRQEVALLASLSGLTEAEILTLDWSDYLKIKDIFEGFLA